MVFPDFANRGFDDLHEEFEEGGFSDSVGTDDGDSGWKIDTELQLVEQKRLIGIAERHIVSPW